MNPPQYPRLIAILFFLSSLLALNAQAPSLEVKETEVHFSFPGGHFLAEPGGGGVQDVERGCDVVEGERAGDGRLRRGFDGVTHAKCGKVFARCRLDFRDGRRELYFAKGGRAGEGTPGGSVESDDVLRVDESDHQP